MMIKVRLRQKAITNGRCSLYLDFYPEVYDLVIISEKVGH